MEEPEGAYKLRAHVLSNKQLILLEFFLKILLKKKRINFNNHQIVIMKVKLMKMKKATLTKILSLRKY